MRIFLPVFILALVFSSAAVAQDAASPSTAADSALANSLNLRLHSMQVALNESRNLKSELELVETQRDALETLSAEYGQMVQGLVKLEKTEGGMKEGISLCLRRMDDFEKTLSSDILLPHQSAELRKIVFAELVRDNGGNLISTLAVYYPQHFTLDKNQERGMKEITLSAKDKLAKAKREYEEKIKKIRTETESAVHEVLTPKQSKLLTKLSGRKRE
jgi:Spy/CpxP family protein refolding chaperone